MSTTSFGRVWCMPLVFAVLTAFGLLDALVGPEDWRWLSWLALASPVLCALWFCVCKRRQTYSIRHRVDWR